MRPLLCFLTLLLLVSCKSTSLTPINSGSDPKWVGEEQYDLLFLRSFFESEKGQWLLATTASTDFREALEALGGYDASGSGAVIYEGKPKGIGR